MSIMTVAYYPTLVLHQVSDNHFVPQIITLRDKVVRLMQKYDHKL